MASPETPKRLRIRAGQASLRGSRERNDDSCGLKLPEGALLETKGAAAVICDGVSSSEGGRIAAQTCVQGFLADYYSTPESWTVKTSCEKVLSALNRWLFGQGQRAFQSAQGMVTTLSILVIKSASAHLFHVGDARIGRLREGMLEPLTTDHRVNMAGQRQYLARAMGADPSVQIDYRMVPVEEGDLFLLTTDGVHDTLDAKALAALLAEHGGDPERGAAAIAEAALGAGSSDNCTAQVIRIDQLPLENEEELFRRLAELPFPPPLGAGAILDGYRIRRELHASNRTQVFQALNQDSGEICVLKTPSVNFEDDPGYIERFRREEWAGRRIRNPHVLKVLEFTRPRRFLYYVTEFLEGQTLREWMHDHPHPPLARVRPIAEQIGEGLVAFHRLEMAHRDLKPENILIGLNGQAKIIDFGSVRIAGLEEIATPLPDRQPAGTRGYSAPECFQGHPGDDRSDLFSLAAIVYEMLAGVLPYPDGAATRSGRPKPYVPVTRHAPAVPAWVEGALAKALSWNPLQRHADVSEFLYDLSHPNPRFTSAEAKPLLERDPAAFWRGVALVQLGILVLLIFLLLR